MEQRSLDAAQPPGPGRLIDEAAKAFMNRNLSHPISLGQISRHVGVCPHHLIRVFRRRNATSPMQYLRQLRVNKAKRLLHEPALNISQVGQAVGYDVLPHFSRMFKRATGMSPRQFRRSCSGLTEPIAGAT
jgi:AraC-like DNA-binding protein